MCLRDFTHKLMLLMLFPTVIVTATAADRADQEERPGEGPELRTESAV